MRIRGVPGDVWPGVRQSGWMKRRLNLRFRKGAPLKY
jgi:hypothetical protein